MKRKSAKLVLHRETIRTLSGPEMKRVHGGDVDSVLQCIPESYVVSCMSWCGTCDQACVPPSAPCKTVGCK